MFQRRSLILGIAPLLFGCSEGRVLNLEIVTGHETSAMTEEPAVANVVVTGTTADGGLLQAQAAPGEAFDFGAIDGSLAYNFEATGFDAAGNAVLRGRALSGIVPNGVPGDTFQIFAQRLRAWARPPGELARTHTRAPAVTFYEQYLVMTGGDAAEDAGEIEVYDLYSWAGIQGGTLSFPAHTMWSDVDAILALGSEADGEAIWFDDGGPVAPPDLPEGLTGFGEVAGGAVVLGTESRVYIVGGARAGTPTDAVLEITPSAVTVRRLAQKRAGAAAMWLADVGLVVAGGSAEGPGVEVLGEKATAFVARDFPPDPTTGAGATGSSYQDTVILIGGTVDGAAAKTRTLDLGCTNACAPESIDLATPDVPLTRVAAYHVADKKLVIAVGDEPDPSGLTHTFLIEELTPSVTELPLREPRRWATSVPAPNGTLALMGGVHPDGTPALTIEMLFPE